MISCTQHCWWLLRKATEPGKAKRFKPQPWLKIQDGNFLYKVWISHDIYFIEYYFSFKNTLLKVCYQYTAKRLWLNAIRTSFMKGIEILSPPKNHRNSGFLNAENNCVWGGQRHTAKTLLSKTFKMKLAQTSTKIHISWPVRLSIQSLWIEAVQDVGLLSSTSVINMHWNSHTLIAEIWSVQVLSKDPIYSKWRRANPISLLQWAEHTMPVPFLLHTQSVSINNHMFLKLQGKGDSKLSQMCSRIYYTF